jgi:hypothetical protein
MYRAEWQSPRDRGSGISTRKGLFYVAKVESTFTTVCATSIKTALGLRLVNL